MEIRCPNCGWTSEFAAEAVGAAIAAAEQRQADHHIEHCPRCQWVIRVPLGDLRAAIPAPAPVVEAPAVPALVAPVAAPKKPRAAAPAPAPVVGAPAAPAPVEPVAAPKKPRAARKPTVKKAAPKKAPAKKVVKKAAPKKAIKKAAKKPAKKAAAKKTVKAKK